ncbi:hypothetical protein FB567DRAFT_532078 [Paraphoma chrysanthemicola]|uniref:Uncharacterized protein n=1 Tax=Paraphoma chrysanthemicola TaxID=798071 RepID=A0A8K0R2F5_9PLEO|nr:hypothetical protein FB567DRAFT_532078 [Paraphoma chrysanthemicola]
MVIDSYQDRGTMAGPPAHFRFLDLPVDLRLMVYERLPVETRHLPFGTPDKRHPLDLVWSILPGITILCACRRIYEEAAPILEPRLRSLRDGPLRMTSSAFGIDNGHLHLLAEYAIGWGQQPDREIFEDPYPVELYDYMHHYAAKTGELRIEIAVGNVRSIDIADASAAELQSDQFFCDVLKFKFKGHDIHSYQSMGVDKAYVPKVKISFRPALWNTAATESLLSRPDLQELKWDEYGGGMYPEILLGDVIYGTEWQRNWKEGERQW